MQSINFRFVVLIVLALAGAGLYSALGEARGTGTIRWPLADAVYAVDGWTVGPEHQEDSGFITRAYSSPDGRVVTLSLFSNQAPKLYGAGAEVPFLGSGYTVQAAPAGLTSSLASGVHMLVARQGADEYLVAYAYGERRGLLGNGPLAWSLAISDGLLGRENDYYKLYLSARADASDANAGSEVSQLAGSLFPRIAAFYAG